MRTAIASAALFALTSLVASLQALGETVKVEAFTFAVPEGWKSVTPSSPMRKAQLEIARGPEKAEVTFFHFGADQGGSAQDNVARWYAQFPGSEKNRITEHLQIGSVKITFAMTEGTFSSGMPGGPTTPLEGYALCGDRQRLRQNDRTERGRESIDGSIQENGFGSGEKRGAAGIASQNFLVRLPSLC